VAGPGRRQQRTAGDHRWRHDGNPTWSPDGTTLAFTSRRSPKKGETTLHALPIGGPGETRTLATMPDGVGDVRSAPTAAGSRSSAAHQDERYACPAPRTATRAGRRRARSSGSSPGSTVKAGCTTARSTCTSSPPMAPAAPRNLTPGEFQHGGVTWLADSSGIVTSAQRHDTWDLDFADGLYLVPLDGEITAHLPAHRHLHQPSAPHP
jgi:hypothetical protein